MGIDSVKQHFADILTQIVTNAANDDIAFLVNQERGFFLLGSISDRTPQGQQVVQVPLQFFLAFADTGSTHNDAHAIRNRQ